MEPIIQLQNVSKQYGEKTVLRDVNLDIMPGQIIGYIGPNGAGKSSLMRTIATLQEADHGSIMLGDLDVIREKTELRKVLGYLPQEFGVYPKVSAYDMLEHIALLKGITGKRKELVEDLLKRIS